MGGMEVSSLIKVCLSLGGCDDIPLCGRMRVLQSRIELSFFQIDLPNAIRLVLSRQFIDRLFGIYPVCPPHRIRADPTHLFASLKKTLRSRTTSGREKKPTKGISYVVFSFKLHMPTRQSLYSSIKWNFVMAMDMGVLACRCEGYGRS